MLDSLQRQLCDVQGRLFVLSGDSGCASEPFIRTFMLGETAAAYDRPYDRSQWMGEGYLFEEVDKSAGGLTRDGERFSRETLFWIGYTYRYWHFLTGESSREIYAVADARQMARAYPGFHTLDPELAIERLREIRSA